jgi:hypothetical protein
LAFYGVNGKPKLWFELYLRNRYERVLITNNDLNLNDFSAWEETKHGVPQGSILGPLLFLLYINDLPKTINDKTIPILFTDNTSLLATSPNLNYFRVNIDTAFHCINEWFKVNLLSINLNETQYIQFTANTNNPITNIKSAYDNKQIQY